MHSLSALRPLIALILVACAPVQPVAGLDVIDTEDHWIDLIPASDEAVGLAPRQIVVSIHQGVDPCDPGDGIAASIAQGLRRDDFPISLLDERFEDANNGVTVDQGSVISILGTRPDVFGTAHFEPGWLVLYRHGKPDSVRVYDACDE